METNRTDQPLLDKQRRRASWHSIALRLLAIFVLIAVTVMNSGQYVTAGGGDEDALVADFVALDSGDVVGYFPHPWNCDSVFGIPDPGAQTVLSYHTNWHCNFDPTVGGPVTPNWGARFFGFHKQLIYGYDRYRVANGWDRVETWDPAPNAVLPMKHGEPVAAPATQCGGCTELPDDFKLPAAGGTLDTYTSPDAIGQDIVDWHNSTHVDIADARAANGGSDDMQWVTLAPQDPLFWHFHNMLDEVHEDWLTHQAADIMVVFDRSGSMSLPAVGGGTKLDAAKSAAQMFADLLEDGSSHTLGMVSFSTAANNPADMPLTSVAGAPAAMSAALGPIVASGMTTIGGGLQVAQTTLDGGSNERKAILLLTDGMENTAPMIADVEASLDATHLCSIGYGEETSLDGPKLRNLSERQGGIYVSGSGDSLELKKFFVDCFGDIFDTFVGEDPIEALPAGQLASSPTIHTARVDDKIVFVLAWSTPVPAGTIQLSIATPSGAMVDLTDPAVESVFGPTWHIVRFKTPYKGEGAGEWKARAIRPYRSFVNGFTSGAFVDVKEGAALIMDEIRRLCPGGCQDVLYYEDIMPSINHGYHNSAYRTAVYREQGRGTLANVVQTNNPADFASQLPKKRWDLIVYASQHHSGPQSYDGSFNEQACSSQGPRVIATDNRGSPAAALLRCLGAAQVQAVDWKTITGDGQLVTTPIQLAPPQHSHGAFSYGLQPVNGGIVQANNTVGSAAVIARGTTGADQRFFITALARADARVRPFSLRDRNYTGEALHPAYRITQSYWPAGGYDSIKATLVVTRPLQGLGNLTYEGGSLQGGTVGGDGLTPRQATLLRLDPKQTGSVIRTESQTFPLYDDGTHGDTAANDHYWEVQLPPDFAKYDGQYYLHAYFTICRANICIQREAEHAMVVDTKVSPTATQVSQQTQPPTFTRKRTRVLITPRDASGNYMGPGLIDSLLLQTEGDVRIERKGDVDGRGTYEVIVNWTTNSGQPSLIVGQPSRPGEVLKIPIT